MVEYLFHCKSCGLQFSVFESMKETHQQAKCPNCGHTAVREYTPPQVKRNEGFFSWMLGREVSGQRELDRGMEEIWYKNDMNEYLGNNKTPEDEWVEETELERIEREARQSEIDELHDQMGYYDSVETYDPEKEVENAKRDAEQARRDLARE